MKDSPLDIVDDVKLVVLDYISLPADLRALSLASKSWNHVVTPKLYGSICIDVWVHGGELELFVGCLELGAKKHMKTTKELHFVDATMDPADPSSIYPQRNTFILEILKSLADDKLRSFRYLCTSRLSTECLSYLSIHQKRIKDLHVPGQVPLELIVPPLVNLTLGFTYTNEKTEMVLSLMDVLPSLNSLCLAIKSGWTSPVEQFWTLSNKETAEAKKKRTKIRATALILTGFMPPSFSSSFDTIFDLSLVTQLILRDCTLHYVAALKGMENLTRFELNCYEQVDEEHCENLLDFCEQSPKLNDLRLITRFSTGWYDDNSIDHLPSYVQELPRNVSVLVLHDSYLTDVGRLNSMSRTCYFSINGMRDFRDYFQNLTELGLSAPDLPAKALDWGDVDPSCLEDDAHPLVYLTPILSSLSRLKLLHLYQPRIRMVPANELRTPDQIARDIDKFAMKVFVMAGGIASQLAVLIWGVEHDLEMDQLDFLELRGFALEKWPKHYYGKAVVAYCDEDCSEDADADYWDHDEGEEFVVPTRTTLDRLRDDFPELKLLSYDPTYNMIEHCASQI